LRNDLPIAEYSDESSAQIAQIVPMKLAPPRDIRKRAWFRQPVQNNILSEAAAA
jgi:hypothetical protein